jgi:hypothetical protein
LAQPLLRWEFQPWERAKWLPWQKNLMQQALPPSVVSPRKPRVIGVLSSFYFLLLFYGAAVPTTGLLSDDY